MHQKFLGTVAAVAIVTALAGPVAAADMAGPIVRKAPPVVPAVVNWTGFYLGGHAGYGWSRFDNFTPDTDLGSPTVKPSGLALGFHAGYNWQLGPAPWGSWLVGIEGDATITPGWQQRHCEGAFANGNTICSSGAHGQLNWLSSLRGRLGFTFDRTLIYATGGVAWASRQAIAGTSLPQNGGPTEVKTGAVFGGGIEWKYKPTFNLRLQRRHYLVNQTNE